MAHSWQQQALCKQSQAAHKGQRCWVWGMGRKVYNREDGGFILEFENMYEALEMEPYG